MMQHRTTTPLLSRFAWLLLIVGVLGARGLTPDGWMPVANGSGGIEFALCDGMGPIDPSATMSMAHGKMHHKAPAKGQADNHPCTGAGINLADTTPPFPAIAAPRRPLLATPSIVRAATVPGRGLAAPPPPATGPPALA